MTDKKKYPKGQHPNSLKALEGTKFSATNQPSNESKRGISKKKKFTTLFNEVVERKITAPDVINGAKREVTVAEAVMLKLVEAAIVKGQPWAIERFLKEMMHSNEEATEEMAKTISPAVLKVLEKANQLETLKEKKSFTDDKLSDDEKDLLSE